ncbi:hypothetical protein C9374_007657 [Naegleria lovaniensis]|uniref:Oligopeptide transporter n=1 Tax=Naegleria lovaniensis TaxID=51637 RepID=A0AA88KLK5_NAELO|nr:uncharacterized protein C9374_007657 [Naegleria lovaniensis]KAG2379019.1 hypothetical protein C9374_007657 [Naegleria lovaniensis]
MSSEGDRVDSVHQQAEIIDQPTSDHIVHNGGKVSTGYVLLDGDDDDHLASRKTTDHFDEHERRMNDESTLKQTSSQQDHVNEESVNDDDEEEFDENDTTEVGRFKERGEFTFRAIAVGALIGILVGAMNVNFGLRTGWTQGGSIFASILSIGVFKLIRPSRPFTKYETIITTTAASSAGTMASTAGLVSSIPALKLLGFQYNVGELYLWALSVAFFGVYFAVPLRKHLIVIEKLRFPTGTATAATIKSMFAQGYETVKKARMLVFWGVFSALYSFIIFLVPPIAQPPMPKILHDYGFTLYMDPLMIGGGMLSGPRSTASLLLGAIVGWGILAPIVDANGWTKGPVSSFSGARGWTLWVGLVRRVAIRGSGRTVQRHFGERVILDHEQYELDSHMIPWWYCFIGLIFSSTLLMLIGHFVFDLKWYFVLLAIPLSAILSIVATRATGETDINPVGGMGKVGQFVFAGVAPKQTATNILSAGIISAGASQAGDMMHDLKAGYIIGVAPRKQFFAQIIGIVVGIITCIPIYKLYDTAYTIGSSSFPAPAAHAWKAVAEVLSKGTNGLPTNSVYGIIAGVVFGVVLTVIYKIIQIVKPNWAQYFPSALAFGIGMIVPPKQSITMFIGAMLFTIWKRRWPETNNKYFFAVSSGLIAGEGIMGIFIALLKLAGLKALVELTYT